MKNLKTAFPLVLFWGYLVTPSCAVEYGQEYHENLFASYLAQALNFEQNNLGTSLWLTNHAQILPAIQPTLPPKLLDQYERRFLKYGNQAGFSNSLFERYVLLPRGVKAPSTEGGEIMLVANKPLKKENGKVERVFVFKVNNRFEHGWVAENRFQQSLREAGLELSQLPTSPPLPSMRSLHDPDGRLTSRFRESDRDTPLWVRTQAEIANLCERFGLSPGWAVWIQRMAIASFAVFLWLCIMWLLRRFGRNRAPSGDP